MDPKGTRMCTPSQPNFFHFHVVFGKHLPNNRLVFPSVVGAPTGKSWIHHCYHSPFGKHMSEDDELFTFCAEGVFFWFEHLYLFKMFKMKIKGLSTRSLIYFGLSTCICLKSPKGLSTRSLITFCQLQEL